MRTLRTPLAALLLTAAALTAPAMAAGGPGRPGGHGPGAGPGLNFDERLDRVADILDLNAAQRAAFDALRSSQREAARGQFETMRALHGELDALLDSGSRDAAAIGAKMIELRDLRESLRAQREAGEAEFVKLLNDEQRIAYDALREARDAMRGDRGPGFFPRHDGPGARRR